MLACKRGHFNQNHSYSVATPSDALASVTNHCIVEGRIDWNASVTGEVEPTASSRGISTVKTSFSFSVG